MQKENISVKFINNGFYIEKDNLIVDKFCPKCERPLLKKNNQCQCGHVLEYSFKKNWYYVIIFFAIFIFTLSVSIFWFAKSTISDKIKLDNISTADVIIMTSLKNSPYKDYIQSIYINPKKKNELIILIKPAYWNILKAKEKQDLKKKIASQWQSIFKQKNPSSKEESLTNFANKL